MSSRVLLARISLFLALVPASANSGQLNLAWDNDLFTGSDRGYTNGVRLSYLTSTAEASDEGSAQLARTAREGLSFLPGIADANNNHAMSVSLRQLMVTPENISSDEPQFNDIPYAGHLSLSSTLWSWNADSITGYGAHIGVVGPESGAEASQKWVHKITGSERPRGWDNQLGTDVVGGLQAAHGRKLMQLGQNGELQQQLSVVGSTLLSSFRTTAKTGLIWRLGKQLPMNFVPDYAGTSSTIALPGSFSRGYSSWSVFVGLGLEYVAYSYLEDNAGQYRFKESPFLGQLGIGGTWQWDRFQTAFVLRATTGEEDRNKDNFSFGTLSLSWAL
ncbi:lipid A deacylase LpxR family protein [Marinobacter sp. W-8]|uniref:lipid A deacylase LpxR family protein n=1 Tax=Marinobacter sp. W-8 TaxID=3369658 RepID=UPI0037C96758